MMSFFSKVSSGLKSLFNPIKVIRDPYHYLPSFPIEGVNFDFEKLCPENLKDEDKVSWVKDYAGLLSHDEAILFKGKDDKANIVYTHQGQLKHFILENMGIAINGKLYFTDKEQENVFHNVKDIKSIGITLAEYFDEDIPHNIKLADADDLIKHKWDIYLKNKVITSALIEAEQEKVHGAIDNIEAASSCPICLDEYTQDKPPVLFHSGHTYHATCIMQHGDAELQKHDDYIIDPLNRAKVEVYHGDDYHDLMTPNLTLKGLLDDISKYEKSTSKLLSIIDLLVAENTHLKEQLMQAQKSSHKSDLSNAVAKEDDSSETKDPEQGSQSEVKSKSGLNFNH